MGGNKGYTFIDNTYKNKNKKIQEIHLKRLDGNIVAVDFTGMLHRFARQNIHNENHYILEVINIIEKFKQYNIIPLFVIDGRPVPEKIFTGIKIKHKTQTILDQLLNDNNNNNNNKNNNNHNNNNNNDPETEQETETETEQETETEAEEEKYGDSNSKDRINKINKLKKKCFSIRKEHIDKCKNIFDKLNCLYIHINNYEADPILALLVKLNIAKYVYSEDFDMCLYTDVKYVLRGLDYYNNTIKLYDKQDILKNLNLTSMQLIDIAFLTGTDYNYGLYKSTMDSNLELIQKYKTIETFILNIDLINIDKKEKCKIIIPTYNFNYELVRTIFTLKNIDEKVSSSIVKYINDYNSSIKKNKTTSYTIFNIKNVLESIKSISDDTFVINKYSSKLINYCKLHFGITINIE
jgi:hypothetical protein